MRRHVLLRRGALVGLVGLLGLVGSSCEPQPHPQREFWRPWYEAPDPAAPDDPAPAPADPGPGDVAAPTGEGTPVDGQPPSPSEQPGPSGGPCALTVSVTTATFGGAYAPNNIDAIWIQDGNERFIKTLAVWGNRRQQHLERWVSVTASAGLPNNKVDAVSAATLTRHGPRAAVWNCADVTGTPVANGDYQICFEMTESNGAGPLDCARFTKGTTAWALAPPDLPTFKKRSLLFAP
jgi:hypothetical protein